jgi:oligopeptide/dipeptide ABC transporter ATP-binding protein
MAPFSDTTQRTAWRETSATRTDPRRGTAGAIRFLDQDLSELSSRKRRTVMRGAQVVFQDPYSSMNPRMTVHVLVAEALRAQTHLSGRDLEARLLSLLDDLQRRLGLTYFFIAHDLAVVESMAHALAVMYLGRIVEHGPAADVFRSPRHPYTVALLRSSPSPNPEDRGTMKVLEGDVPSAVRPPEGCRFHPRCPFRMDVCTSECPQPHKIDGRLVSCHLPDDFDTSATGSSVVL